MAVKNGSGRCRETVYAVSLGCPKNLVNTEIITGAYVSAGSVLTFDPENASCYIINTCAFLASAREEAAETISAGAEWKQTHPEGRLVVAGCLAAHPEVEDFKQSFPEVDLWAGPNELEKIIPLPEYGPQVPVRLQLTLPHVAYLKIADGCDNRCAYCLIPQLRGDKKSRSIASCIAEAEQLIKGGVKELILIAQDTTAFGSGGENLAMLLTALEKVPGDFRYRILYTHPAHYTDELIGVLSRAKKFIPALDIPIQHISDRMLKAMNRHTDSKWIRELIVKLRKAIPGIALRTTFIAGFPGETEADYQELLAFAAEARFERLGVFAFSPEPGTAAFTMKKQVPADVGAARARELMRRQHLRTAAVNSKVCGTEMTVMIDDVDGDYAIARSDADAPEIDQVVYIAKKKKFKYLPGDRVRVRIAAPLKGGDLEAEII